MHTAAADEYEVERAGGHCRRAITYRKHGYGVEARFDARVVDFDFGEHGDTDGFDVCRPCASG